MWLLLVAACIISAAAVCLERKFFDRLDGSVADEQRKKKVKFDKSMTESEYIKLIPDDELKLVRRLLRRAHAGWGEGSAHLDIDKAWHQVLHMARLPEGGSWTNAFECSDLEESRLRKLSKALDETFLGGLLRKELRRLGVDRNGCLGFSVDDDSGDNADDWISYFDEANVVHLLRSKWSQDISDERPMSCEGVLCSTRLELLAHTLAHEMVHAIVFNFLPEIDESSEAYLPDERHGPIFKLLNKRLFGHSSDSYKRIFNS